MSHYCTRPHTERVIHLNSYAYFPLILNPNILQRTAGEAADENTPRSLPVPVQLLELLVGILEREYRISGNRGNSVHMSFGWAKG
jgi:hypothetical protein